MRRVTSGQSEVCSWWRAPPCKKIPVARARISEEPAMVIVDHHREAADNDDPAEDRKKRKEDSPAHPMQWMELAS